MKPFLETQRVFSKEQSQFLWNRNMTGVSLLLFYAANCAFLPQPCDLSQCLTKTVRLYCDLMGMSIDLVQAMMGRARPALDLAQGQVCINFLQCSIG
ncbi:hypothetical protein MJO28_005951 [Puccinia striiformis f. sp. tritici]|uniref:Uncharacterized protein n=1 Tax=Puccinia striiformis f. sp. tritici TaxID=168172 RepID=A0ACC0EGU4_9BASI|nr:hypothetical protein MJO28_005951 [Puccinia striiformis f. sp. tritici]